LMKTIGAFLQKRGDWSWYKQALGYCGWRPEGILKQCCYKCRANFTTLPFTDPSLSALWRSTILTHEVYMQMCRLKGWFIPGLFDLPGFRAEYVSVDLMHTGDLGICLYLYGNVLWDLMVDLGGNASSPGKALGELMFLIRNASKAIGQQRPPFNKLTVGMLKQPGKAPKLKIKAAESRYFLPVLLHILEHFVPCDTHHREMRLHCVRALNEMYKAMKVKPAEFDGKLVATQARKHLIIYADLGQLALQNAQHQEQGWVSYRWYPKHHMFNHFEMQVSESGSPSDNWCYADESEIGVCVKVAESCHPLTLHRLAIEKMRIDCD
jgi:hypothetical protein